MLLQLLQNPELFRGTFIFVQCLAGFQLHHIHPQLADVTI